MDKDIKIEKILKHFPHNICFVYFLVDSILDGENGQGCFSLEGNEFVFCKDEKEREFWRQNIRDYKFLFTAAMLKYYSNIFTKLQEYYDSFVAKYYGEIADERKLFFNNFIPLKKDSINITDYIFSEPDFALTQTFDFDNEKTIKNGNSSSKIVIIKKELTTKTNDQIKAKEEIYGRDYIYVSSANNKTEDLQYNSIPGKLQSTSMKYTSRLILSSEIFIDVKNVISFAKTDKGYVYIVKEGKFNYLRSQGFSQTARLIRTNAQPIIVKANGPRVAVLFSDGTLTSNFCNDIPSIRKMWFDKDGNLMTEKYD